MKKRVLRIFGKFTRKHLCQMLFFNKVAGLSPEAYNFNKKETLAQVFYYELCEISSNTFFTEHLREIACNNRHLMTKQYFKRKLGAFTIIYWGCHFSYYVKDIPQFKGKHNFFQNSFFPSVVIEWNKLDLNIRNSESLNVFKNSLLKFIRPSGNSAFNCHNPRGFKLLTRLRLSLSHLREHKFKHGFQDSLNTFAVVVMISKL